MKYLLYLTAVVSLLAATGCDFSIFGPKDDDDNDSGTTSETWLVVTTSDYMNSTVARISIEDFSTDADLMDVYPDNVVTCNNGSIYILERQGADNIIRIDGPEIASKKIRYQENIGTAVNIQDIAVISKSKAYVTQFGSSNIAIVDPSDGSVTGTIDLGREPYLNGDETVPFMGDALIVGGYAYIALQRLVTVQTDWGPTPQVADSTGMIVVIDCETDKVAKKIKLKKTNPASLDTCDGYLYVSSPGSWNDQTDGGIEKIDCSDNTLKGTVISGSDFGGDITTLVIVNKNKAYVTVGLADYNFSTVIIECDLAGKSVGETIDHVGDAFGGIAYDGTYLYIGDRSTSYPGIMVIDPDDNSKVAGPIDCGTLPPSSIAVLTMEK